MTESIQLIENEIKNLESIQKILHEKNIEIYYRSYPHLKQQFLDSTFVIKEELSKQKHILKKLGYTTENIDDLSFVADNFINEVNQLSKQAIEENLRNFRNIFAELKGSLTSEDEFKFDLEFDKIPEELKDELIRDIEEARKCFSAKAYRATLIFCGRVLEIVLSRKYFEKTQVDPLEQNWKLGVLIGKCSGEGILSNEPTLGHFANIINDTRIQSVHKTTKIYIPEKDETLSLVSLTNTLVKKLFP